MWLAVGSRRPASPAASRSSSAARRPFRRLPDAARRAAAWALAFGLGLTAVTASAADVSITLLHTTDLHGRLFGTLPAEDGRVPPGNLLRVASVVRAERRADPHAILIDTGDTLQGTPEGYADRGRAMLETLRAIGCQVWVLGNHEFDWGMPSLVRLLRELDGAAEPAVLAANITAPGGAASVLPGLRPYTLIEVQGVRIAIIGLTTPGMPAWFLPEALHPLLFERAEDCLPRVLRQVRAEKPDLLVLAAHQGVPPGGDHHASEIRRIARRFPEFDVILGGHTHIALGDLRLGPVLYNQPPPHGAGVGRVRILYDPVQRRVLRKEADNIPVDETVEEDPVLRARLAPLRERFERELNAPVGLLRQALPAQGEGSEMATVGGLLREAIAEAAGVEVVVHGILSPVGAKAGPLTERDLWRLVPYDNRIGILRLTFGELKSVLEEAAAYRGKPYAMGLRGAHATIDPKAPPGARVRDLRGADGARPHARRRIPVAFNSHTLASGGLRFPVLRKLAMQPETRLEMTDLETRDAVRTFLKAHPSWPPEPEKNEPPSDAKAPE